MKFVKLGRSKVNPYLVLSLDDVTAEIKKKGEDKVTTRSGVGVLLLGAEKPFFVEDLTVDDVVKVIEEGINGS